MSERMKELQADMIRALKQGDKTYKTIVSSIIALANSIAKNDGNRLATDADVIQAVQKTIKDTKDTLSFAEKGGRDTSSYQNVIDVATKYLPKQLEFSELVRIINDAIANGPDGKAARGYVMKHLTAEYKGQFDPKEASEILTELGV